MNSQRWIEQNNRFHEELIRARGEGWQAFWGSRQSQQVRFGVFAQYLPLAGRSILDVGCGFGDFYSFLQERHIPIAHYVGVDLDPLVIAKAREYYPKVCFEVCNILEDPLPFSRPEVIVASGIMAVPFEDWDAYAHSILRKCHELAGFGFAINFLSVMSKAPNPRSKYVEPWTILEWFQRNVDWRVLLVHDYKENDFTLIHTKH